jgi:integrase
MPDTEGRSTMATKNRNATGTGSLFRQTGRGRSRNWMMQYYDEHGTRFIRSTGTSDKLEARKVLNQRIGAIASGETVHHDAIGRKACRFEDAVVLWDNDQVINDRGGHDKGLKIIERHLAPVFGGRRLDEIQKSAIDAYYRARLDAGAAKATINGELSILRRMFTLAITANRFTRKMPTFDLPDPKNEREGFFEREQFEAVLKRLPAYWRGPATFAYATGWRVASEIALLEWRDIDTRAGVVTLRDSKNGEGRVFPYRQLPELVQCLADAARKRDAMQKRGRIVARVFHRDGEALVHEPSGSRRTGSLCRWAQEDWRLACRRAGCPDRTPHDFRRTAVRNLVRASVPEKVAMKLTGHKTRSVFDRYNIVNDADLAHAVGQLASASPAALGTHAR